MIRLYTFLLLLLLTGGNLYAQVSEDSVQPISTDTNVVKQPVIPVDTSGVQATDSVIAQPVIDTAWKTLFRQLSGLSPVDRVYKNHRFFAFGSKPFVAHSDIKQFNGKEVIFYTLVGLFLLFAFLRTIFAKYIIDLFRLFFRRTLKQRQITEQLSQTPLPSLVMNAFFIITAGLYTGFILQHFRVGTSQDFWILSLYSAAGLAVVYLIKFLVLKFTGWVLGLSAATDSYIFIVFIINKVIGIYLLPFLVLLAFTQGNIYQVAVTLSWCGVACLFAYRFILSYSAVRNQVKVKPFHFLVYLFAFEIVPLLLIYKLLLYFLF